MTFNKGFAWLPILIVVGIVAIGAAVYVYSPLPKDSNTQSEAVNTTVPAQVQPTTPAPATHTTAPVAATNYLFPYIENNRVVYRLFNDTNPGAYATINVANADPLTWELVSKNFDLNAGNDNVKAGTKYTLAFYKDKNNVYLFQVATGMGSETKNIDIVTGADSKTFTVPDSGTAIHDKNTSYKVTWQCATTTDCKWKVVSQSSVALAASPTSGSAPLTVTFDPVFLGMGEHWIDFGDGTRADTQCSQYVPNTDRCSVMKTISHTYSAAGTYTASLRDVDAGAVKTWGSVVIKVGAI